MSKNHREGLVCPSGAAVAGAELLGAFDAQGKLIRFSETFKIDAKFVEVANLGRSPTKRFRFVQPCIEDQCAHWKGSHCGIAEHAAKSLEVSARRLPPCRIRQTCRWFHERGADACAACTYVVTDCRIELR
jgi:hypothetical protein